MPKRKEKFQEALGILGVQNLKDTLEAYNPWWNAGTFGLKIPDFRRDLFPPALRHIESDKDLALLINGPRRVGKTTLIKQLIRHLINEKHVLTRRILFFSLDDPVIQQLPQSQQGALFESILGYWAHVAETPLQSSPHELYCFLDEVQRLPRWELYLKRYIDLRYPIRFVISGSASHTIFRRSLESLLGRIREISLPPFTFREFVRFHFPEHASFLETFAARPPIDITDVSALTDSVKFLENRISSRDGLGEWTAYADGYAQKGGFPQLWNFDDEGERTSFVEHQYVQRVTLDDLYLVKEIRRPEIIHQFLRYAFARTGQEYNLEELAAIIHTTRMTLSSVFPLLLQTELIRRVDRYSGKPVRLRSTHAKLYAVDPVLAQAVNKVSTSLSGPERGRIAETLALNVIRRFPGVSDICYYLESKGKKGTGEIDFIVRAAGREIPIEAKYQFSVDADTHTFIRAFMRDRERRAPFGVIVTRDRTLLNPPVLEIPLPFFLLLA